MFNIAGIAFLVLSIFFFGAGVLISSKKTEISRSVNTDMNIYERIQVSEYERKSDGKARHLGRERGDFIEEPPSDELVKGSVIGDNGLQMPSQRKITPSYKRNSADSSTGKTDRLNLSTAERTDRLAPVHDPYKTERLVEQHKTDRLKDPNATDRLNSENSPSEKTDRLDMAGGQCQKRKLPVYDTERKEAETDRLTSDETGRLYSDKTGRLSDDKTGRLVSDKTGRLKTKKANQSGEYKTGRLEADKTGRLENKSEKQTVSTRHTEADKLQVELHEINQPLEDDDVFSELTEYQNEIEILEEPAEENEDYYYDDPMGFQLFDED